MKISERTISRMADLVTGNNNLSPYKTGPQLVRLFNEIGFNDVYGEGFPSRQTYTESNIREINDTNKIITLVKVYLDPREFIDNPDVRVAIIEELNKYLKYDGYEIFIGSDDFCAIKTSRDGSVEMENENKVGKDYITEQLSKCKKKLQDDDYSGAITNARTLMEEMLLELIEAQTGDRISNDGDIIKLFKTAQKYLNLDPSEKTINQTLKQILQGLMSIINGLAALRNKMSDAHGAEYRAAKHHAKLAVNAAVTLADFLYDTHEYQLRDLNVEGEQGPRNADIGWSTLKKIGSNQCECSLITGLFPGGIYEIYDVDDLMTFEHCDTCKYRKFICNKCGPINNILLSRESRCPSCGLRFITDGDNIQLL